MKRFHSLRLSSSGRMLHTVKLALSSRGEKELLATDQRLQEADQTLGELQRWFPQIQVVVEENEKNWTTLGYNIRTLSRNAQEIYPTEHPMQYVLDHLHMAGSEITAPGRNHALYEQRARAASSLRAFNDRIRELRSLQMGCVAALKEKEYYHAKVETLRVNEGRKKKVTERDVDKRLRNEQKLAEVVNELNFKWDRLQKELAAMDGEKGELMEEVLWAFTRTQQYFFELNPMGVALSLLANRRPHSTSLGIQTGFSDVSRAKTLSMSQSMISTQAQNQEVPKSSANMDGGADKGSAIGLAMSASGIYPGM